MGRSMLTMTSVSDHTLFIYGGLGIDGNTLGKSASVSCGDWAEPCPLTP